MLLFFILLLVFCCIVHFYNHFTFILTKHNVPRISYKHEHHGPYPVIFNIYCVLQVIYSLYIIIYFTFIAIPDNIQLLNTMYFILFYPISLIRTNNNHVSSPFVIEENMIYSNIKDVTSNFSMSNGLKDDTLKSPFMIINITLFAILILFEGFFNFYTFWNIYNVQNFTMGFTLFKTIKKYLIYSFIFIILFIITILFNNILLIFILALLHSSFNIFCEYRQISILLNHSIIDSIDDHNNNTLTPLFQDELAEILKPLYVRRKFCVSSTILSTIYLIGIFTVFKSSFDFLIFYPIFFGIITCLQTMSFIRNRSFIGSKISSILCCSYCNGKSKSKHIITHPPQTPDNDLDNEYYENHMDNNMDNMHNMDNDRENHKENKTHQIQVTADFADIDCEIHQHEIKIHSVQTHQNNVKQDHDFHDDDSQDTTDSDHNQQMKENIDTNTPINNIKIKINHKDSLESNLEHSKTITYINDKDPDINNGTGTEIEKDNVIPNRLDMSPIRENVEADINDIDIEALMVQQITEGMTIGPMLSRPDDDSESEEVSSLLVTKSIDRLRSPNSVSNLSTRDDMVTIDESNELIDFSGIVGSPLSMGRYLSSPTANLKVAPPTRQHSKMEEISVATIDQILGGRRSEDSQTLTMPTIPTMFRKDTQELEVNKNKGYNTSVSTTTNNTGTNPKRSINSENDEIGAPIYKNSLQYEQTNSNSQRQKVETSKSSKNSKSSKRKNKSRKNYKSDKYSKNKLEADQLSSTLRMLVNSGLVKQQSASYVKSIRKRQIRQQRILQSNVNRKKKGSDMSSHTTNNSERSKSGKSTKVEEEISFLLEDNDKRRKKVHNNNNDGNKQEPNTPFAE